MSVVIPHRAISVVAKSQDKKQAIFDAVGDISGVTVFTNQVLVGQYVGSNMAGKKQLIIRPDTNIEEDVWQGKVGLVLKLGPLAFQDDGEYQWHGQKIDVGEWGVFKVGDGFQFNMRDWTCRIVRDSSFKLKVEDPSIIL